MSQRNLTFLKALVIEFKYTRSEKTLQEIRNFISQMDNGYFNKFRFIAVID